MAVNVKTYVFDTPPELRSGNDEIDIKLQDWEAYDFWEFDMEVDKEMLGTALHHFPKVWSAGRCGGHLTFDYDGDRGMHERLIQMIQENRDTETQLCYEEEYIDEAHYEEYGTGTDLEVADEIESLLYEIENTVTFIEDATKWVEHVVRCKKYREDNLRGVNEDYLQLHVDNERYDIFDLAHCTAVFDGEKVTVSWPQHARVFKDHGTWVDADAYTPGAVQWSDDGKYRVWVRATEPSTFWFELTVDEFIEAMDPNIAEARRLLSK